MMENAKTGAAKGVLSASSDALISTTLCQFGAAV
jgi:hypothetical protein